jgi:TPR repeat protein
MANKRSPKKRRPVPKTVLRLPDLDQAKAAVLNSLSSRDAQRGYQRAADQGFARAQFNLGLAYARGTGVHKSATEAFRWYQKAAEQGLAEAEFSLGTAYARSEGVQQDYIEAVRWFRAAAEKGLSDAQLSLGIAYANGVGVSQDYETAAMWIYLLRQTTILNSLKK